MNEAVHVQVAREFDENISVGKQNDAREKNRRHGMLDRSNKRKIPRRFEEISKSDHSWV